MLGPGLVTGASDDDPSGIATYSQVGAQFGYGMLWTMVLSYPLMAAIQEISARVGRVTGCGISANLRRCYPRWLLRSVVALVLIANIFNLGADIGAMGAAAQLLLPARTWIYILLFGIASLLLQVLVPYTSYVKYLKWLTLSLFAYVATAFFVQISWPRGAACDRSPATVVEQGLPDGPHCRAGNDDQSLSLLLASLARGGRGQEQSRGKSR